MTKTKKALFGIALAAVLSVGASSASAATSAELQAQINALMAQLAAMQAPAVSVVFTSDLTVGSTGAQVVALQSFLESKGYLVMPVGVAKGYFGGLTRAAVVKFQLANGITPAVGYFGPKTRAAVIAMLAVTPGQGPIVVVPGTGTEGSLENDEELGSVSGEDLEEGDDAAEVVGISFEAEDSNMTIDRVDVDFEMTSGGSESDRLDRYVDSVSIWLDGKKLADGDVDEADEDSDVYSFRFTGLNGVVKNGDEGELVVAVDVVSNIDGDDDGAEWTVTIPEDGIRATDTKGISDTYFADEYEETFTVGEATPGDASVNEASTNPDTRTVEVDDDENTDDVTMLVFEIDAEDQDVTINDIPVTLAVSAGGVGNTFTSISLYHGSTLIDTESVGASGTTTTFEDVDVTVDADDSETFTIKADISDIGTGFASGQTASTTVTGSAIDAEDEMGDSVTVSGVATGETVTFRTTGLDAQLTSITESNDSDSTPDLGTFTFKFKVTAFGDDVYVSATSTSGESNAVVYTLTGATVSSSTLTSTADEESNAFVVEEGDTEDFTFTVIANGNSSFTDVEVTAVKWGTSAAASYANTSTVDEWESDPLFLSAS